MPYLPRAVFTTARDGGVQTGFVTPAGQDANAFHRNSLMGCYLIQAYLIKTEIPMGLCSITILSKIKKYHISSRIFFV
jgi:hypothetical protein